MTEKEISRQITRYINGELNDREEDLLWEEFLENKKNYQLFETELNLADLYRNKRFRLNESDNPGPGITGSPSRRHFSWIASIAAVILLVTSLSIFLWENEPATGPYALNNIAMTSLVGSDIFRDEAPSDGDLDQQINQSLSLALSGNTASAIDILNRLKDQSLSSTQKTSVFYNLGILAYNDGNFDLSLENFTELSRLPSDATPEFILENSKWFIANIYLKQGKFVQSVQLLDEIAKDNGTHASKADAILESIGE